MKRVHQQLQRKLALPGGAGRRQPWRKLVDAALIEARHASGAAFRAEPAPAMRVLSPLDQLRLLRRDCQAGDFPIEGQSAALIGEAFLKIIDAFAAATTPSERRRSWAELVRVAAEAILEMLEDANQADVGAHAYWLRD